MKRRNRPRAIAPITIAAVLGAFLTHACSGDQQPASGSSHTPATPPAPAHAAITPAAIAPNVDAPRVRLALSGFMEGALEPCGCASGQLGGLARRAFYLLAPQHEFDLRLEGGNLIPGPDTAHLLGGGTALDREKMSTALGVLDMVLHYDVLAIGPHELLLPYDDLALYLTANQVPVVSSDLRAKAAADATGDAAGATEPWPGKPFVEKQTKDGKQTVRIAALTGSKPDTGAGPRFELLAAEAAWTGAMQGVAPETYRILLVHGHPDEVRARAKLEPRPDLIVGISEQVVEPPLHPEAVDGVPVVFPGIRGRMLLDVTLARPETGPVLTRYHVVKLEGSATAKGALEDRATKDLLLQHRQAVAQMDLLEEMADQVPTPSGATYLGNKACAACHAAETAVWEKTRHAHAWETLVAAEKDPTRYGWPVTQYPDCVSCHVVGYRRKSGFVNQERTPQLVDVGCEQCHGPGSEHPADPSSKAKITRGGPETCLTCHNFEQSPKFSYLEKWKLIEHHRQK